MKRKYVKVVGTSQPYVNHVAIVNQEYDRYDATRGCSFKTLVVTVKHESQPMTLWDESDWTFITEAEYNSAK